MRKPTDVRNKAQVPLVARTLREIWRVDLDQLDQQSYAACEKQILDWQQRERERWAPLAQVRHGPPAPADLGGYTPVTFDVETERPTQ